jgi:hypothetical protein
MNMDREVARRRPANVVMAAPSEGAATRKAEISYHRNEAAALAEVHRLHRNGEAGDCYLAQCKNGTWAVKFTRIKAPSRRAFWLKLGGGLTLAGAGLAVLAWAVHAIVMAIVAAVPVLLGFLGIAAVVAALGTLAGGGRVVEVIQKVTVR